MKKNIIALFATITIAISSIFTGTPVYAQEVTINRTCDYPYAQTVDGMNVFNFNNYQAYGASDNTEIMAEGFYGLRLATNATTVIVTPYRHNSTITEVTSITYGKVNNGNVTETIPVALVSFNENTAFDLKGQADGVYRVNVSFKDCYTQHGYLIKEGDIVHTCQTIKGIDAQTISNVLDIFHRYTDNLNPNDYLSLNGLTYPSAGSDLGFVDDVASIAQFSKDNFTSEVWNDEATVFAIVNWLNNNIAYDTWRTKENNGESRAHALSNYTDPSLFAWHNKVGVCWDYSNMLAIMCRAQGIPATTIDTEKHTWNIVYINNHWASIDVCDTGKYESRTYDGNKDNWTSNSIRSWSFYTTLPRPQQGYSIISVDDQIWTRDRALGK